MSLQNSLNQCEGTKPFSSRTDRHRSCNSGRPQVTFQVMVLLPSWVLRSRLPRVLIETISMLAPFSSSIFLLGRRGTHVWFYLDGRGMLGGLILCLGLLFLGRGLLIHVDLFFTNYQNPKDKGSVERMRDALSKASYDKLVRN